MEIYLDISMDISLFLQICLLVEKVGQDSESILLAVTLSIMINISGPAEGI
jgi:hypothetical protein